MGEFAETHVWLQCLWQGISRNSPRTPTLDPKPNPNAARTRTNFVSKIQACLNMGRPHEMSHKKTIFDFHTLSQKTIQRCGKGYRYGTGEAYFGQPLYIFFYFRGQAT